MNYLQKRRLYYLALLAIGLTLGVSLILYSLKQNMNVFLTPSQIKTAHLSSEDIFHLGGLVKKNSVRHEVNSLIIQFIVTDYKSDINVRYEGVLPDLFREGKGVIVNGKLNKNGIFIANQVLAKHDENYMPKNVYKKMREQYS